MSLLQNGKADVLAGRYDAQDSIMFENVSTAERDAKKVQEIGDVIYNSDNSQLNLLTGMGWVPISTGGGGIPTLTDQGILYGNSSGGISQTVPGFTYNDAENIFVSGLLNVFATSTNTDLTILGSSNIINAGNIGKYRIIGDNNTLDSALQSGSDVQIIGNFNQITEDAVSIGNTVIIGNNHYLSDNRGDPATLNNICFIGSHCESNISDVVVINATSSSSVRPATRTGSVDIYADEYIALRGSLVVNTTNTSIASSYDVVEGDNVLLVNPSVQPVTITIPRFIATEGKVITIKDTSGNASVNNITIDPEFSDEIDGQLTYAVNTNYGSVTIVADSNFNWYTI